MAWENEWKESKRRKRVKIRHAPLYAPERFKIGKVVYIIYMRHQRYCKQHDLKSILHVFLLNYQNISLEC